MDTETKKMFELILSKLDNMEKRQDEMYIMQRALEENAKVTRAEQEKMMYLLADIQGKAETNKAEHDKLSNNIVHLSEKVEGLRKDFAAVEIVTARNLESIAQLKLIK